MSTVPGPIPPPWRECVSGQVRCGFRPDQTFRCELCADEVCWCKGGSDDYPDLCAECAMRVRQDEQAHAK